MWLSEHDNGDRLRRNHDRLLRGLGRGQQDLEDNLGRFRLLGLRELDLGTVRKLLSDLTF